MKKLRSIKPGRRKRERKDAQKIMERQVSMLAEHPTECCVCNIPFERTKEAVKTWQVTIREDRVRLTCPSCWGIIKEGLERIQND
jgi:hypothetical protein